IVAFFPQRLADAGRDAAVRLAVQDQRVHGAAAVVHAGPAHDLDRARLRIDLDLAHRAAVGKGRRADRLVALARERTAEPDESVPMTTSIRPSGRTVISARSRGAPVFSSR